jgi:hypothetical protein
MPQPNPWLIKDRFVKLARHGCLLDVMSPKIANGSTQFANANRLIMMAVVSEGFLIRMPFDTQAIHFVTRQLQYFCDLYRIITPSSK